MDSISRITSYLFCIFYAMLFGYTFAGESCSEHGVLMKDPSTPCKYLQCVHGRVLSRNCPSGLGVQPNFDRGHKNPCIVTYDQCDRTEENIKKSQKQEFSGQPKFQPNSKHQQQDKRRSFINMNFPKQNNSPKQQQMPSNIPNIARKIPSDTEPKARNINLDNIRSKNQRPQNRKHLKQLGSPPNFNNVATFSQKQANSFLYPPQNNQNFNNQQPFQQQAPFQTNQNFDFAGNPNGNFDSEFQSFLKQVSNGNRDTNNNQYFNNPIHNPASLNSPFDDNQFQQVILQHDQFNIPSGPINFPQNPPIDNQQPYQHQYPNQQHPAPNIAPIPQFQPSVQHQQFRQVPQVQQYRQGDQNNQQSYQIQPPVQLQPQQPVVSNQQVFSLPQNTQPLQVQLSQFGVSQAGGNYAQAPAVIQVPIPAEALYQIQNLNNNNNNQVSGYPETDIMVSLPTEKFTQQQPGQSVSPHVYQQPVTAPVYSNPKPQAGTSQSNSYSKASTREQQKQALAKLMPFILNIPKLEQLPRGSSNDIQKRKILARILQRLIKAMKSGQITTLNRKVSLPQNKLSQLRGLLQRRKTGNSNRQTRYPSAQQQPQRPQRRVPQRRRTFRGGRRRLVNKFRQGVMGKMANGRGFQISPGGGNGKKLSIRDPSPNSQKYQKVQEHVLDYSDNEDYTDSYKSESDFNEDENEYNAEDGDYSDYGDASTKSGDTFENQYDKNYDSTNYDNEDDDNNKIDYSAPGTNAPATDKTKFRHMRDGIRIPISFKEGSQNANISPRAQTPQQSIEQALNRGPVNRNPPNMRQKPTRLRQRNAVNPSGSDNQRNRDNQYNRNKANVNERNEQSSYSSSSSNLARQFSKLHIGSSSSGSQRQPTFSYQPETNLDSKNNNQKNFGSSNVKSDGETNNEGDDLFKDMPLEYLQLLQEFAMEYVDNMFDKKNSESNEIPKYVETPTDNTAGESIRKSTEKSLNNNYNVNNAGPSVASSGEKIAADSSDISTIPPLDSSSKLSMPDDASLYIRINKNGEPSENQFPAESDKPFTSRKLPSTYTGSTNQNTLIHISAPMDNSGDNGDPEFRNANNEEIQLEGPSKFYNDIDDVYAKQSGELSKEVGDNVKQTAGVDNNILEEDIAFQEALTYYSKLLNSLSNFVDNSELDSDNNKYQNIGDRSTETIVGDNIVQFKENAQSYRDELQNYSYQDMTTKIDLNEYESNVVPS